MGARLALAGALLLLSIAMGADALACGPRGRHHHHMAQTAMPRGGSPAMLPQPGSHGAQLVGAYCTQCHGTPSPALHYSGDWRSVAERMYGHMQRFSARVYAPTDEEFAAIVAYMESNAADRRQLP
jgi:cytochrome c5